jgi:dihydrofolate synthase/folylpolyglutamate synthase
MSQSATAQLFARESFGIKLGLDNMLALAAAMDHPQRAYDTLHIAGTNGKGSVTAMLEQALHAAGCRSARYTSPHLVRLEERFVVAGAPLSAHSVEVAAADVLAAEAACRADGRLEAPATFFELTTMVAFELFRKAGVDIAVIEVGLGGRFDATNIIEPRAAAITSISLDHERHLGRTLGEIAFEKAGIIKPGIPVVVGDLPAEAEVVIQRIAEEQFATLIHAHEGVEVTGELDQGVGRLTIETQTRRYGPMRLALAGRHQIGNAIVVTRLLEALDSQGLHLSADAICTGIETVRWRGRLERIVLSDKRELLIDAAHNPAGAESLASYVRDVWPSGVPFVIGAMEDKDLDGILAALAPVASHFIVTRIDNPRAASLETLAAAAERHLPGRVQAVASPREAMSRAWSEEHPAICVAGSIFLLGALLPYIDELRTQR